MLSVAVVFLVAKDFAEIAGQRAAVFMKKVLFRMPEDLAIRAATRLIVSAAEAISVSESVGTWPIVSSR